MCNMFLVSLCCSLFHVNTHEIIESSHEKRQNQSYKKELQAPYWVWFAQPGNMLSVFDNASDMESSVERVHANATYIIRNLHLIEDESSPLGAEVNTDFTEFKDLLEYTEPRGHAVEVSLGERNNPFFTYYPELFIQRNPDSYMRDIEGNLITTSINPIRGIESLTPAICDDVITRLASTYIRSAVTHLKDYNSIHSWVIGSEESYPDYFGLPLGDYRPAFLNQFRIWLKHRALEIDHDDMHKTLGNAPNPTWLAWYHFREQAMADRAAIYMTDFIATDSKQRPVLFPTHGNPFSGGHRRGLGVSPSLMVGACDGFEMGHISIDDDEERLNLLFMTVLSAYGQPLSVPRLGNKTLDETARGGGRTFTPVMLRRLVYECLGMGVNHIGPIHWRASLGDGEWFIKDTPTETTVAEVFQEIHNAQPLLAGMARVQPRIGLYVSDTEWVTGWNQRWTAFFHDMLDNHWHATILGDALLSPEQANQIPLVISIENRHVSEESAKSLLAYLQAGGRVLSWGEHPTVDMFGYPLPDSLHSAIINHVNLTKLEVPPLETSRTIVNRFQTGTGAWEWPHTINPVDFDNIVTVIQQHLSTEQIHPIRILEGAAAHQVTVLPLTDGFSLMTVLINNRDTSVNLSLQPAESADIAWQVYNGATHEEIVTDSTGYAAVELEPNGTQLIWFTPETDNEQRMQAIDAAQTAFEAWRVAGADTAFLTKHREFLEQEDLDAKPVMLKKAYALAHGMSTILALRLDSEISFEGDLIVRAKVIDAQGTTHSDVDVLCKITPDSPKLYRMQSDGTHYTLHLPSAELTSYYDPFEGKYAPITEARRISVMVQDDVYSGGASMLLLQDVEQHDTNE